MNIRPIKTSIFTLGESLPKFIARQVSDDFVKERMILAVTSKIVSLSEGRIVSRAEISKTELIKREADIFLGAAGHGVLLTIKEGLLIASAGIDESNSADGHYILYPENPYASAKKLWSALKTEWGLTNFGLIFTDSRTSPLRQGVTGICLAHWGFRGIKNMIGTKDLFGRELRMTKINVADSFAATAALAMGEGAEAQPLALITGADCEFSENTEPAELRMDPREDLYFHFFRKPDDN